MKTYQFFLFVFFLFFGFLGTLCVAGDSYYLTFVPKNVSALQPGDVTMKIEGKDATVKEVLTVDTKQRSGDMLWHPAGRRTYLFVFDFINSTPQDIINARKVVESFVTKAGNQDLFSVAGISHLDGLKMFCLPTTDPNKVRAGLNAFGVKNLSGYVEGPEGNLYPEQFSPENQEVSLLPDAALVEQLKTYAVAEKDKKDLRAVYLQSLADLGFVLSVLEGRKDVILFGSGVDAGGLSVNLPLRQKVSSKKETTQEPTAIEHEDLDSITDTSYEKIQARSTMGPRRKPQKQSSEALPDFFAGSDSHVFMFHFGSAEPDLIKKVISRTGGLFLKMDQDTNAGIDQILATDAVYQVVGFVPPAEGIKDLNSVKLDVKNESGATPSSWLLPKHVADYTSNERKAKIAETIYKDAGKPSDLYRFWSDFSFQDGNIVVPAFVQMDGPGILKSNAKTLDVEFFAYALQPNGPTYDFSYFLVSMDLENKSLQDKLSKSGVKVWNPLLAGKGPVLVRTIIMNSQTGEVLTHTDKIEINDTNLTMTQPFFPSMNLNWVLWPNPLQSISKRNAEIAYPYRAGKDMYFSPDITPIIKNSDTNQVVYFRVYNMPVPNKMPTFGLRLQDQTGQQFDLKQVSLLQRPDVIEPKGMAFFWKLQSIPQVTPGDYRLKIATLDSASNKEVAREVPAKVQQ